MLKMCNYMICKVCSWLNEVVAKSLSQSPDKGQTSHAQHPTYHHNSQELSPYTVLNLTIMKPRGAGTYMNSLCICVTFISITHLNQHGSSVLHLSILYLHTLDLDQEHIFLDQGVLAALHILQI